MSLDNTPTGSRRAFLTGVGSAGVAGLSGCVGFGDSDENSDGTTTGDTGPETVVFGQPGALTGAFDFLQPGVSQAADAAKAHINDAGGPLDAELDIQRRDTGVDPQEARTVVTQLIKNDDAVAIVGLFSSEINPLWEFLQEQQTPVVTPWPGSTFLDTNGGDAGTPDDVSDDEWVWRTVVGDTVHTAGSAVYALEEGYETLGVINGNTEGERSYVEGFVDVYENNGGTVVEQIEVELGQSTYQSALGTLFEADFDAFLVSMPEESAITALSDWTDAGYGRQPILSDTLAQQSVIEQVGAELQGAWVANPGQSGPNYDTFEEIYREAGDAEINGWTPPSWDAVTVTALAIERAGEATPEAIERNLGPVSRGEGTSVATFAEGKEALANGDEITYEGAATPVTFTQFGNVVGPVTITIAQETQWDTADEVTPEDLSEFIPDSEY